MTEYLIAIGAGLISFLSPCVLPIVPGFISYIVGKSFSDLQNNSSKNNLKLLPLIILFIIGFSIVFVSLGATATLFGSTMLKYSSVFTYIVGIIIIFFSLNMIGVLQLRLLNQEFKYHFQNKNTALNYH